MKIEDAEKDMIRNDLQFVVSISTKNPALILQLMPYISLIAIESNRYFNRHVDNANLSGIRAKVKFLDDTKNNIDETINHLGRIWTDHQNYFADLQNGRWFILRYLQKDLGEHRYDNQFLGTTLLSNYYSSLSQSKITLKEQYNGKGREMGFQAGELVGQILHRVNIDIEKNVTEMNLYDDKILKHKDYRSKKYFAPMFYGAFEPNIVQLLQIYLSMLNMALRVMNDSNVNEFSLFKMRYITIFHILSSIKKLQSYFYKNNLKDDVSDKVFKEISSDGFAKLILRNKNFRDTLVHYRIREFQSNSISPRYLSELVESHFGDLSYGEFEERVRDKMKASTELLDDWMNCRLSN